MSSLVLLSTITWSKDSVTARDDKVTGRNCCLLSERHPREGVLTAAEGEVLMISTVVSEGLLDESSLFSSNTQVSKLADSFLSESSLSSNPGLHVENLRSAFCCVRPVLRIIDIDACRIRLSCGIVRDTFCGW